MLHKHAATIRPYPPPTRQHAAARPNSRQIRQMSAMPANPPFQSQLAARPNNRRHHQPTATHPQTTSTPNLSQTLMISRQTLVISRTALIRAPAEFAAPLPSRKSPQIPKITVQTTSAQRKSQPIPNIPKITVQTIPPNRSNTRITGTHRVRGAPPIPKIPPNPKSSFRQPAQLKSQPIPKIP